MTELSSARVTGSAMEIPEFLITQVREGKVVLFLGSGASMDATDTRGKKPPSANALADMLADRFLSGKYKGYPLNQIAEYAISESDLGTVQAFIRDIFAPFEPSKAHELMTTFRWYGLATTNYDQIIEKAYSKNSAVQEPRPLIENTDRVEENLRDPKYILLLKLHGCISRISNPNCPLILTTEQYVEYRQGRDVRGFENVEHRGIGEGAAPFVGIRNDNSKRSLTEARQNLHWLSIARLRLFDWLNCPSRCPQ